MDREANFVVTLFLTLTCTCVRVVGIRRMMMCRHALVRVRMFGVACFAAPRDGSPVFFRFFFGLFSSSCGSPVDGGK